MKESRFIDSHIQNILKQAEMATSMSELCREHGMCGATSCKWRTKEGS